MTSTELKALIRKTLPGLKKPFFGDDTIICRDKEYPDIDNETSVYETLDALAWSHIEDIGLQYEDGYPDCDDFSDIQLGRFKEEWWKSILSGAISRGVAPKYASCIGYNPSGEMHNFQTYVADGVVWVSDYGQKLRPEGYRPLLVRF